MSEAALAAGALVVASAAAGSRGARAWRSAGVAGRVRAHAGVAPRSVRGASRVWRPLRRWGQVRTATTRAVSGALAGGMAVVAGVLLGPGAGVLVAVLLGAGATVAQRRRTSAATAAHDAGVAPALEAVARSLRSGASLPVALGEATAGAPERLRVELADVATAVDAGAALSDALAAWGSASASTSSALAAAALSLAHGVGGPSSRAVDAVAVTLRQAQAASEEATALAAQARLSAMVIGAAPVAFSLLGAVGGGDGTHLLFHTGPGVAMLAGGLGLDALGALWMERLTAGGA